MTETSGHFVDPRPPDPVVWSTDNDGQIYSTY